MKLLQLDSSALGESSVSRQLTAAVVESFRRQDPALEVVQRDLAADPPGHLDGELLQVVKLGRQAGLTKRQAAELDLVDRLVGEVEAADILVIGAPMYNFAIPTQLKAWIDRVLQAGRTFRYTETGPVGLLHGKRAVIVSTRGGRYAGLPAEALLDHQEAHLRAVLGFVGITDVTVVRAEGVAMGEAARDQALQVAQTEIHRLALPLAA